MHEKYYYKNYKYSTFLDNQKDEDFRKIVYFIIKDTDELDNILDVGCGSGNLLRSIRGRENKFGIDISSTSVQNSTLKQLKCSVYDGKKIPFEDEKFNLVCSFNVLEHVDDIDNFLAENLRVLKRDGYLILACPNFLSITNGFHWHTAGLLQKIKNVFTLISKLFCEYNFNKMKTVEREDFHPDDDACNITNPIDIIKWAKKNNLLVQYWSSQSVYKKGSIINLLDKTFFKVFLGACFFVFKKNNENIK